MNPMCTHKKICEIYPKSGIIVRNWRIKVKKVWHFVPIEKVSQIFFETLEFFESQMEELKAI